MSRKLFTEEQQQLLRHPLTSIGFCPESDPRPLFRLKRKLRHGLDGPSHSDFVQLKVALRIHHFKFFQDAISLFIEIQTNGLIV